ncbi:MAG: SIMPL domain-containing protein [Sphingomonas sp.]
MMLLFAATVAAPAGAAQTAPDPAALHQARGEVLLQVSAMGSVHNPADDITITIPITASSSTAIAARAANQAVIDRLKRALIAKGIDPNAISLAPMNSPRIGFIGNETDMSGFPSQGLNMAQNRKTANSVLQVKLSETAGIRTVRDVLDAQDQGMVGAPAFSLKDDRAAHQAAVKDAIAKARADAESYAAALGLHVVSITRVSNQGPEGAFPEAYLAVMRTMTGQGGESDDVVTEARVWIDFKLAPR